MEPVTVEQVKASMVAGDITRVEHGYCEACLYPEAYLRMGDDLYHDSRCNCPGRGMLEPREWDEISRWINATSDTTTKVDLAAQFGIPL